MSGILEPNIELKEIKAPGLTSTDYGKNIKEQFENIDDNFRRVSNRDYVAGKNGANISVVDLELVDSENDFTTLGWKLLSDLVGVDNIQMYWDNTDFDDEFYESHSDLKPVVYLDNQGVSKSVHFFDYVRDVPYITVLYTLKDVENQTNDDSNRIYICSPQVYTFLDKRYADIEEYGGTDVDDMYGSLEDCSCLLNLKYVTTNNTQTPVFTRSNLFPTLYYDEGFRWKIYDSETGIRAMGPAGVPGKKSSFWLVRVADTVDPQSTPAVPNTDIFPITHVAVMNSENTSWSWEPVSTLSSDDKPDAGDVCIALQLIVDSDDLIDSDDGVNMAFVSPILSFGDSNIYVTINSRNAIGQTLEENQLYNLLLNMGSTNPPGGLFIPYVSGNPNGAHCLYHTDVNNKHVLNIVPKTAIDFTNSNYDSNSTLNIKYDNVDISGGNDQSKLYLDQNSIRLEHDERLGSGRVSVSGVGDQTNVLINTEKGSINVYTEDGNIDVIADNGSISIDNSISNEDINIKSGQNVNITPASGSETNIESPATAAVSGVSNVYLGCPIGTIVMYAGTVLPDNWEWCRFGTIGVELTTSGNHDFSVTIDGIHYYFYKVTDNKYSKLANVINTTYGIEGSFPGQIQAIHLPDLQQRFPLGAKRGSMNNGFNSNGIQQTVNTAIGEHHGSSEVTLSEVTIPGHSHGLAIVRNEDAFESSSQTVSTDRTFDITGGGGSTASTSVTKLKVNTTGGSVQTISNTGGGEAHSNMPPYLAVNFIIKYR